MKYFVIDLQLDLVSASWSTGLLKLPYKFAIKQNGLVVRDFKLKH